MHVEVGLYLATLFFEEHRKQKPGAEQTAKLRQHPRSCAGTERLRRMAMAAHQIAPDNYMAILDIGQARVDIFLLPIRLGSSEDAVEIRRIRLILPMVLESMHVRLGPAASLWIYSRCHGSNMPDDGFFWHRATIRQDCVVIRMKATAQWR